MKFKKFALPLALVSFGLSFLAHGKAQKKSKEGTSPQAKSEMQAILDVLATLNGKSIPSLSPSEARLQPTPTDAVVKLLQDQGELLNPQAVASILHLKIPGPIGEIPLNIYMPNGHGPFPVIVYFHGGGFVIADTKVYESSVRALVNGAEAIVVSVDYHRAPEYKFPNQPNEAYAAYKWVVNNAAQINGDAKRIAVAGESAGGNLAAVVSLMARDHKEALPIHQLLIYPVVDNKMSNSSYTVNANAKPLDPEMMEWFFMHYLKQQKDANNPYAFPNKAKSLKDLPPTTLITAEIDPLMTEGKEFAERLKGDGVPVAYQHYEGVTHEFFGMASVLQEAKEAQGFACGELKKAFSTPS